MKKELIYLPFVLAGATIGYFIGAKSGFSGWDLFGEMFWGGSLIYAFAVAIFHWGNEYGVLIGAAIGLLVSLSLDWMAGSPVDLSNKLSFMFMCSFVGWGFRWGKSYWNPVIVGGFIGGIIGFGLGLSRSHWFGQVCLDPGVLNASLMSVEISVVGLGFASLFMKSVGWRYIEDAHQA